VSLIGDAFIVPPLPSSYLDVAREALITTAGFSFVMINSAEVTEDVSFSTSNCVESTETTVLSMELCAAELSRDVSADDSTVNADSAVTVESAIVKDSAAEEPFAVSAVPQDNIHRIAIKRTISFTSLRIPGFLYIILTPSSYIT
jgi:hypothetical protein